MKKYPTYTQTVKFFDRLPHNKNYVVKLLFRRHYKNLKRERAMIKLALLDNDANYLNRFVAAFNAKYADKFEIHSFTDAEYAMQNILTSKIDFFIADADLNVDVAKILERCCFAYFVSDSSIDKINGYDAVGKFQKTESIYKRILNLYSEKAVNWSGRRFDDGSSNLIVFSSPCGGAGTSTMAASCAMHFASLGKEVLYLNFEKFGCSDSFFSAEGQYYLNDIIFALKRKKTNLSLKLESCVRKSENGVCFYSHPKIALDMLNLTVEDMSEMIAELKALNKYEYIILDTDFCLSVDSLEFYEMFDYIVWCSDGSNTANSKIVRTYEAIKIMGQNDDYKISEQTVEQISEKIRLIYNKFSGDSKSAAADDIKSIGIIPYSKYAKFADLLNKFACLKIFDKLIKK